MQRKPVIGVVGGIGSGKSFVAAELARGGLLISGDRLGHEALRMPENKQRIVDRWGPDILDDAGEIDRRKLGRRVFASDSERLALEAISFPYIERRIRDEIERGQADSAVDLIVLDAAIMLEVGWAQACDEIIYVETPRDIRLKRLAERGWDEHEATRREAAQMPLDKKKQHATALVYSGGPDDDVRQQLVKLRQEWAHKTREIR